MTVNSRETSEHELKYYTGEDDRSEFVTSFMKTLLTYTYIYNK